MEANAKEAFICRMCVRKYFASTVFSVKYSRNLFGNLGNNGNLMTPFPQHNEN